MIHLVKLTISLILIAIIPTFLGLNRIVLCISDSHVAVETLHDLSKTAGVSQNSTAQAERFHVEEGACVDLPIFNSARPIQHINLNQIKTLDLIVSAVYEFNTTMPLSMLKTVPELKLIKNSTLRHLSSIHLLI